MIELTEIDVNDLADGCSINVPAGPRDQEIVLCGEDFAATDIRALRAGKTVEVDGFQFACAEARPAEAKDPGTESSVRATFQAQAWVNDYAIDVDPEGPTSWQVSERYLQELRAGGGERVLEDNTYESDELRHDPAAPEWIRNWHGPFYIEVVDLDELDD